MADLQKEVIWVAREITRGVAPYTGTPPTEVFTVSRALNMTDVTMQNVATYADIPQRTGMRNAYTRSPRIYEEATLDMSGPLDLRQAPFILSGFMGDPTTATPVTATLTREHLFTANTTTDLSRSFSMYWGDPSVKLFQSTYCMLDELTIPFGADADEAVQWSMSGVGRPMTQIGDAKEPVTPTSTVLMPAYGIETGVSIDTATIGTTALTGKVISGEIRIPRMRGRKRHMNGTGAARTFDMVTAGTDRAELTLTMELYDMTQYQLLQDNTDVAVRVNIPGDLIETGFYGFFEFDIYGPLQDMEWDEYTDTNRTLTVTIRSHWNTMAQAAGHDYRVRIRNASQTV